MYLLSVNMIPFINKCNNFIMSHECFVSSRFSSEEVSAQNQVKASVQRKIRQSIAEEVMVTCDFFSFLALDKKFQKLFMYVHDSLSPPLQYPGLEPVLDELLPKKSALVVAKWFVILLVLFL